MHKPTHLLTHSLTHSNVFALLLCHLYINMMDSLFLSFFRSRFRRRMGCDRSCAMLLLVHRHGGLGGRHRHHHHHHRLRPALPMVMILTTTMAVMICSMMVMGRAVCTSTRASAVLDGWMMGCLCTLRATATAPQLALCFLLFCCFSPRHLPA